MNKIKIACTSGISIPLNELSVYSGNLKKHSSLEIERLCSSIVNDGFLFPLAVGKVDGKNYVIDGECRLFALQELEYRGFEIPAVPIFYVKSNSETIRKNIVLATSTNHCVTKYSLEQFYNKKDELKNLGFNEGTLIDLRSVSDFENLEFESPKKEKKKIDENEYFELLKTGEI